MNLRKAKRELTLSVIYFILSLALLALIIIAHVAIAKVTIAENNTEGIIFVEILVQMLMLPITAPFPISIVVVSFQNLVEKFREYEELLD